jgi:hypothetical protein
LDVRPAGQRIVTNITGAVEKGEKRRRVRDRLHFEIVMMIAKRADLFCLQIGKKDPFGESPGIPNVPTRPGLFGRPPPSPRRAGAGAKTVPGRHRDCADLRAAGGPVPPSRREATLLAGSVRSG